MYSSMDNGNGTHTFTVSESHSDHVKNLLDLLNNPEFTPTNYVTIRFVGSHKKEYFNHESEIGGYPTNKIFTIQEFRARFEPIRSAPYTWFGFRNTLSESKKFLEGSAAITIPCGFLHHLDELKLTYIKE